MAKKPNFLYYIIILLFVICFCIYLQTFKSTFIEGATSTINDADDFTIFMNIKLKNSKGYVVPQPLGNYTVKTTSGKFSITEDFSMNEPKLIKTHYDVDEKKNIVNRNITIIPSYNGLKPGECKKNINICNTFPNKFDLDISFNQIEYKFETMANLIAANRPASYLNYIDPDNNLIITSIGTIYDKKKNNIGDVSMDGNDMNNQKSFIIKMQNNNNEEFDIKKIIITFMVPLPFMDAVPYMPPAVDPKIIKSIPPPDPDTFKK
jgi:hypothetical protein